MSCHLLFPLSGLCCPWILTSLIPLKALLKHLHTLMEAIPEIYNWSAPHPSYSFTCPSVLVTYVLTYLLPTSSLNAWKFLKCKALVCLIHGCFPSIYNRQTKHKPDIQLALFEWMNEWMNVSPIETEFRENRSYVLYSSKSQLCDTKPFWNYFLFCKMKMTVGVSLHGCVIKIKWIKWNLWTCA